MKKQKRESLDSMHQNPDNWKWIFYVNPKDPRMMVPKMNPDMGWTINLGHRSTIIGIILIVLILVGYQVFLAN